MHYKQLLDVTSRFLSDNAYEEPMRDLRWHPSEFDMKRTIGIFENFLRAWHSLRHSLGRQEMVSIWTKDVEPYAMALQGEFLENLDVEKIVETKGEKLRVGVAIGHVYSALSTVPGVGPTNASKLLHLRLPHLFVMTDTDIRRMFKTFCNETFSPYSYAFNFLKFVKSEVSEAIHTLCGEKKLTCQQGIEFLRNAHDRKRSLAKLMDECYWVLANKSGDFPPEYFAPLMRYYE